MRLCSGRRVKPREETSVRREGSRHKAGELGTVQIDYHPVSMGLRVSEWYSCHQSAKLEIG